jgi:alpha-L-rhamnosidase
LRIVPFVVIGLWSATFVATTMPGSVHGAVSLRALKTEYRSNPIGIDAVRPRFSWQLASTGRSQLQRGYQILVATSESRLDTDAGDVWDSGEVATDRSVQIEYDGPRLTSRTRYYWKVRIWDAQHSVSVWSNNAFFEMGLLALSDWNARWIAEPSVAAQCPMLRKTFTVSKSVRRARAYATALGVYELYLNGRRVGEDYFAPGWTDYAKRLEYQTYDVTELLMSGRNAMGAIIGNGWYASDGWIRTSVPGTTRSVRLQLEIEFTDGTTQRIDSDTSWRAAAHGPIQSSSIYDGERYDARRELAGWSSAGFDDSSWPAARDVGRYSGTLVAGSVPIRVQLEQEPIAITQPMGGTYIFDMGQNMVGWVRLRVQGPRGTAVRMRFGEVLTPEGSLYTANLRGALQTDTYILRGTGAIEIYEPHFTYHGFRYVEVTGLPGPPALSALTGRVAYAALQTTGSLTTSSPLLDRLYENIVWSQRGNFWAVPTDCPQRDERLGYLGDGQVFAATAALNMDVSSYFTKWSQDIEDAQLASGAYADTAPIAARSSNPSSATPAAGVILPWVVYQSYGDTRIIDHHWRSMVRFMDYLESRAANNLVAADTAMHDDAFNIDDPIPREILANAYYGHCVRLMAEMARATGRTADAGRYETLFHDIRKAFTSAYVTADGQMMSGAQAAYAMAIAMDMLPADRVPAAADRLVSAIRSRDNHLSTGLTCTRDLNIALSKAGRTAVAYDVLNQTSYPSWLFTLQRDATTTWERWDGVKPSGGFQSPQMNSFNHYASGAVGEWMFGTIAGINGDPRKPGYKGIILRPQPGGGLTSARGEYESIHGPVVSEWHLSGSRLELHAEIPANTNATVYVPATDAETVKEGGAPAGEAMGVAFLRMEDHAAVFTVASGRYDFESRLPAEPPAAATPMPGTWTFCANDGDACVMTGTRQVRYGEGGRYAYRTVTGTVPCTKTVFDDPVPQWRKHCDFNSTVLPTPWWTRGRITAAAATLGAVLLVGFGWVWSLQKTVRRQTEIIREKLVREALVAEGSRIAREIHDGLAQAIAAVSLQIEGIRSAIPQTAGVALERLDATSSLVRQTLIDASRSIWEIQVPTEAVGLENALRDMLERFGPDAPLDLTIAGDGPEVSVETEYQVVRVVQEAVANAVRHAPGSRIRVDVIYPEGRIALRVTDDGPGFDGEPPNGRSGLRSMRQRAAILKGELTVHSVRGQGTEIRLEVPARVS